MLTTIFFKHKNFKLCTNCFRIKQYQILRNNLMKDVQRSLKENHKTQLRKVKDIVNRGIHHFQGLKDS